MTDNRHQTCTHHQSYSCRPQPQKGYLIFVKPAKEKHTSPPYTLPKKTCEHTHARLRPPYIPTCLDFCPPWPRECNASRLNNIRALIQMSKQTSPAATCTRPETAKHTIATLTPPATLRPPSWKRRQRRGDPSRRTLRRRSDRRTIVSANSRSPPAFADADAPPPAAAPTRVS